MIVSIKGGKANKVSPRYMKAGQIGRLDGFGLVLKTYDGLGGAQNMGRPYLLKYSQREQRLN